MGFPLFLLIKVPGAALGAQEGKKQKGQSEIGLNA
jgi:hypothetical protein